MKKILFAVMSVLTACSSVPTELPVVAAESLSENETEQAPRRPVILNAEHILKVLGEPTVRRFEAPAEVWVYSRETCVLFIYMTGKGEGSARVKHMEIGTPSFGADEKQSAECLKLASRLR